MELPKYKVTIEEQCGNYEKQVLQFENGATAVMWVPIHSKEKEEEIGAKITKACFEFLFPDEDWNGKNLHVIT